MSDVSLSLYDLSKDFSLMMDQLAESGGELTENQEEILKQIQTSLTTKTDNVVQWVHSQEDLIALADQRIKALQDFKKSINTKLSNFDGYVDACLKTLKQSKIDGQLYKISVRKPRKVVVIDDENKIPLEFIKTPEPVSSISLTDIQKALKEGQEVPGASLQDSKTISISYDLKK